jgi:hypothetical protein
MANKTAKKPKTQPASARKAKSTNAKSRKKVETPKKGMPKSTISKFRAGFYIIIGISLIVFGAVLIVLRSSITEISQDPYLVTLNNNATFKTVQIINRNKNLYEDIENCWNMKNPFEGCSEENEITEGNYVLKGIDGGYKLEGPYDGVIESDIFQLSEERVRETLGGFKFANVTYYQIIRIEYPDVNYMNIEVETINDRGDKLSQEITLEGYPITFIQQNE